MTKNIIWGCLLIWGQLLAAQNATSPAQSEMLRFAAQVSQDTAAVRHLVANDLIYIHSNGLTESADDFVSSIQSGKIVYAEMKPEPNRIIRRYGKSAIITGIVKVAGSYKGKVFDIRLRYTSCYRKKRGHWQLVSWQSLKLE